MMDNHLHLDIYESSAVSNLFCIIAVKTLTEHFVLQSSRYLIWIARKDLFTILSGLRYSHRLDACTAAKKNPRQS